jgi:GntR family carbon starvation induced transcriptional regulator
MYGTRRPMTRTEASAGRGARHSGELREGGRTLVETAYERLRLGILHGDFEPGAKLRTEELRARYNISGSTVREALTRLLGESLVTAEGQRGFRVAPISLDDFTDLTNVRKLLETETLRQSIAHGDDAWEAGVVGAYHRLSRVEEKLAEDPAAVSDEWEERNREFHQALAAACPSRWLDRLSATMYQQSERYRRIAVSLRTVPRDVHAEHKAILEATLNRDADLACRLLAEHINRTLAVITRIMSERRPDERRCANARAKGLAKATDLA